MHLPHDRRRVVAYAAFAALAAGGLFFIPTPKYHQEPEKSPEPKVTTKLDVINAQKAAAAAPATASANKATQQPKLEVKTYTVQSGDTAGAIAAKFGLKEDSVLWANDLEADDILQVGQKLKIPPIDGLVYTVASGDTLWDIAVDHGVSQDEIVKANPSLDPDSLQPDQVLLIPGGKPVSRRQVASSRGTGRAGSHKFGRWPASGPITDPFGWRIHPVYGTESFHDGMDIGVPSGTPIPTVAAGTVTMASWYGGYGYSVRVDHGGGLVTQYSHLSKIAVKDGQEVAAGDLIGYSGNTGVSTGPHLHFMVISDGTPTDPISWLP